MRNNDSGIRSKASATEFDVKRMCNMCARARTSGCMRSCRQLVMTLRLRRLRQKMLAFQRLVALQVLCDCTMHSWSHGTLAL